MKNLKQLSRKEMKSLNGGIDKDMDFSIDYVGCGCTAAFCVTDSNKDGSKYCSDTKCC